MTEIKGLPIITISREYGSGGHSVAGKLAERLGVEFYDKDVIKMAAKDGGYSEEDVAKIGEEISGRAWFVNSFITTPASYVSEHEAVFKIERELIVKLALQGPGIIVGRCANIILREAGIPTFDVFLYADEEHKLARAKELNENGTVEIHKYMENRERNRRNYIRTFTGHELGDYRDYHLSLDTGLLGYDRCVDLIEAALRR